MFKGKIRVEASQVIAKAETPEQCFDFDQSTGSITLYKCGTKIWNGSSMVDATSELLPEGIDSPITDVVIPKTINGVAVTKIERNASSPAGVYPFWVRDVNMGITSVVIPDGVTTIGDSAFYSNQLTSVTIPNVVTEIGNQAFMNNQLTSVVIPNSVTSIASMAFNNNQLPDTQAFIFKRNSDGTEDKTTIIGYGGAKRDNVIIPNGVTTIEANAFASNQITSVTIPNGVTSIGMTAFDRNQLISVTIPSSVTNIGDLAFSINQLTSVTIKGKSKSSDFTTYGYQVWGWASGYSDSNITWQP